MNERLRVRDFAHKMIVQEGASIENLNIPSGIANFLKTGGVMFRFQEGKDVEVIAASLSSEKREVAVLHCDVEDGNDMYKKVVIKIGYNYEDPEGKRVKQIVEEEKRSLIALQQSGLGDYVVPFDMTVASFGSASCDIRVQEFEEGTPLCYLDLCKLDAEDLEVLGEYHLAVLKEFAQYSYLPDSGYRFGKSDWAESILASFLYASPLATQNVLFDFETNLVRIVDTGGGVRNVKPGISERKFSAKKLFFCGVIIAEYMTIKLAQFMQLHSR